MGLIVTWDGGIVDGHNRYAICTELNIPFKTVENTFDDIEEAKIWIKRNQIGRRNIPNFVKADYIMDIKVWENLKARGKENRKSRLKQYQDVTEETSSNHTVCQNSDKRYGTVDAKKDLADKVGVSHDTASRIILIRGKASPEQKARLKSGEASINEIYQEINNADSRALKIRMFERLKEHLIPELRERFEYLLEQDPTQIDNVLRISVHKTHLL